MTTSMIDTPIYDELVAAHPYPSFTVDCSFRWESRPRPKVQAPAVGAKPVQKRRKRK